MFRFLGEVNHLPPGDPWFARLRDAYLEPWGQDRRALFDVAHVVGGFAHAIAWLRQRDNLPDADRPAFDEGFSTILRLALNLGRGPGTVAIPASCAEMTALTSTVASHAHDGAALRDTSS